MTNKEIAQKLYQIAEILELRNGGDRFRITAYQRAAQSVESYGEDIADVYQAGGLKALQGIEGVGISIAEKIEELIKKGKIKYLQDIQKGIPPVEVQLTQVPGIGPKTSQKIYQKLRPKSIKDLKKIIERGKADKYFKEKTRQNLLRGIKILAGFEGRLILTYALPIAEDFVRCLRKIPAVKKVDIVGSLRRFKETVGDIDIIAATASPEKAIAAFIKFPGVKEIISQGEKKATIIHEENCQIDLEILPEAEYGSLLQHFTGSKEHNVALRTYAQTKGYSISEHGVKTPAGRLMRCQEEKELYGILKMDWIPPELREDQGEIEAALAHKLPTLIELQDIKGDLHLHSNWSDGFATIEELAQEAEKLGYEYLAIADHTVGLGVAGGLSEEKLLERQREIEKIRPKFNKLKILSSVEVNITAKGDLDISDKVLGEMDVVIASVHSSFFQAQEKMTARIISAIEHPHVDIIGHPSGRILGQREPYDVDWEAIFRACAKTKTGLEISAFPNRLDLKDTLCRRAKKMGVKMVINTDSHRLEHLYLMRFGVAVARRGWLQKEDILNTLPFSELEKWLRR